MSLSELPEPHVDDEPDRAPGGADADLSESDVGAASEGQRITPDPPLSAQQDVDEVPDELSEPEESDDEAEPGDDTVKPPKTYGRRAYNNLRTARRNLEAADWQPDERSRHLVAEANVLALLDLADAIRGAKGPE